MDEVSMLTAITLFLLSASNELVGVTVLQKGCRDRFQNALNSSDPWVGAWTDAAERNKSQPGNLKKCLIEIFLMCVA